jgi:hypothetical protein
MDDFATRVYALEPYCVCGPNHVRGVAEAVSDAQRFHNWGSLRHAEYMLRSAEVLAGLRPVSDLKEAWN